MTAKAMSVWVNRAASCLTTLSTARPIRSGIETWEAAETSTAAWAMMNIFLCGPR